MNTAPSIVVGIVGLILSPFLLYYLGAVVIWALATFNILFSRAEESTAKPVWENGRFKKFIMSYAGKDFVPPTTPSSDPADDWNVGLSPIPNRQGYLTLPLLRNIAFIGLPPMGEIPTSRFKWSSLEEVKGPDGKVTRVPVSKEKNLDYILLREDVYVFTVPTMECADNIPLDGTLLVGATVVNPYKALYRVQSWLESVENVVGAKMRDFVGPKTYEDLRKLKQPEEGPMPGELYTFFKDTIDDILKDWGVKISFVRIFSLDPGSELARSFIEASTRKYVAEQQRDANIAEGQGLASRDQQHFKAVSGVPGGTDMFKWSQLAKSRLTTYVDQGGGAQPTIQVGNAPPAPEPAPAAEGTPPTAPPTTS